jgi:hypothetical protein
VNEKRNCGDDAILGLLLPSSDHDLVVHDISDGCSDLKIDYNLASMSLIAPVAALHNDAIF